MTLRKFLYIVTFLIILVVAGLFALNIWGDKLTEVALVPDTEFVEQSPLELNAYQNPDMWFSRPGKGAVNDPARWEPQFAENPAQAADAANTPPASDTAATEPTSEEPLASNSASAAPASSEAAAATPEGTTPAAPVTPAAPATLEPDAEAETPRFAVFFVHPTSYFNRSAWNAAIDDSESQARARIMVRGLASTFNQASEIWVPRYRQATFGAFLTDAPEATSAIDAAYRDVEQAFDFFLSSVPADRPIVLAGHSQGAYHITRLLEERASDPALRDRIAMAYPIGWPISVERDLPSLNMPACATSTQAACIVSWASFAEPADPGLFLRRYAGTPGLDGQPRGESPILCVNPLNGTLNGEASMSENLGTLVPNEDFSSGELVAGAVPARCNDAGLLLIGDPPEMGNQRFPGNNYHLVDIPLFWKNLQRDVVTRMQSWQQTQS